MNALDQFVLQALVVGLEIAPDVFFGIFVRALPVVARLPVSGLLQLVGGARVIPCVFVHLIDPCLAQPHHAGWRRGDGLGCLQIAQRPTHAAVEYRPVAARQRLAAFALIELDRSGHQVRQDIDRQLALVSQPLQDRPHEAMVVRDAHGTIRSSPLPKRIIVTRKNLKNQNLYFLK